MPADSSKKPTKRPKSAIPVGTQFSPDVLDLSNFIKAIVAHSGEVEKLRKAVWKPTVRTRKRVKAPTKRLRMLPLEAAVQYGLLEKKTYVATALSKRLAALPKAALHREFAKHVLLECGGLRVVEAVQDMQIDGIPITGDSLAQYLTDQGFPVSVHNTAINTLRMWLGKAGLFPEGRRNSWRLNKVRLDQLLGLSAEDIAALSDLAEDQRAFVKALCRIDPHGWSRASEVRDLAEATSDVRLERGSLPKRYLEPLEAIGILKYKSGGTSGGKSARFRTTNKFKTDVLLPFLEKTISDFDGVVANYYKILPKDIYADLDSASKDKKGKALEAYAVLIMKLLGLRFLAWRKRARSTGYAEVDASFSGLTGAVPTLWQIQCKNTPSGRVDLDHVAREVGLLPTTRATHILIIGNCPVSNDARRFAAAVMDRNPVTIFLLDRSDFEAVRAEPGSLGSILRNQARAIERVRR